MIQVHQLSSGQTKEVHVHYVVQLTPVFAIEEEQIEHLLQFCC